MKTTLVERHAGVVRFGVLLLLFTVHCALSTRLIAGESAGTTGADFLRIAVGPRAVGMGDAFTAVSDNGTALFWNPAGLARVRWREVFASHQAWVESVRLNHAGYAHPIGEKGAWAVGAGTLGSGALEGRSELDAPTANFDVTAWTVTGGAGLSWGTHWATGLAVKAVREKIQAESGATVAADAGVLFRLPLGGQTVTWGASLRDLGGKIGPGTRSELPRALRVGVADRLLNETVILAVDGVVPEAGRGAVNAGGEVLLGGVVALRAGYRFLQDGVTGADGLTAGFGVMVSQRQDYLMDYAYAGQGGLGASHRFGLTVRY